MTTVGQRSSAETLDTLDLSGGFFWEPGMGSLLLNEGRVPPV